MVTLDLDRLLVTGQNHLTGPVADSDGILVAPAKLYDPKGHQYDQMTQAAAPAISQGALVSNNLFHGGNNIDLTSSLINFTFTNDDVGATYNSATLDLATVIGPVVDSIIANNPGFDTAAEVYGSIDFVITPTGNVSAGWSASINPATGLLSLTNNDFSYTVWSHPRIMTGTLNLSNLLDINSNGQIDPNETLAFDGLAENAFVGWDGAIGFQADVPRVTVIPEPSGLALLGVGVCSGAEADRCAGCERASDERTA